MELNVFRAWDPDYDRDLMVGLSGSKCGLLRAIGNARRSVLVNKLMTPMSTVSELMFWSTFGSMLALYVTFVFACASRSTRHNTFLLLSIASVFGAAWAIVFILSYRCRKLLHTPDPYLSLPPWQYVRRGCLLQEPFDDQDSEERQSQSATPDLRRLLGSSVTVFNFFKGRVVIGDFQARHLAYQVRSLLHAFAVLFTAAAQVLQSSIPRNSFLIVRAVPVAITIYLMFEAQISVLLGQQQTFSFRLGLRLRSCFACFSEPWKFEPFDPRAAIVQNMMFSIVLGLSSGICLYIQLEEGLSSDTEALWMLPLVTSLFAIVVTQVGVPYSSCPATFLIGLLVSCECIPKPVSRMPSEKTLLLTYGIFGPVVELPTLDRSASDPPAKKSRFISCLYLMCCGAVACLGKTRVVPVG